MADLRPVMSWSNILSAGAVLVTIWLLYTYIYDLLLSPLSRFPGPKLWAVSRIPSQISVLRGHTHLDITKLHERYGPVVRIGPNELAFNSPQAFQDIYGFRSGYKSFAKDRSHYVLPSNGVDHIVSAIDNDVHGRQRRLLSHAFSERSLRDQEVLVQGFVDTFVSKLREQLKAEGSKRIGQVDIKAWFNYATFDIMGDLMFAESFGCLKDSKLHPWIALLFDSIKALSFMGAVNQFPLLATILQKYLIPKSLLQKSEDHFNLAVQKVDRRLRMGTERPDFMSEILKNGLSEKGGQYYEDERIMSRAEIHSNAFILIIAGSETTATLLSGCIFYLCKYPFVTKRLLEEIRNAFRTEDEITFARTSNLSYLKAVIQESLRIYPPFVTSLARVAPPGGENVGGHWIPEHTIVACHHYASYHSTSNFTLPDEFIPERWLDIDPRFASDKRDVLNPFSLGPRNCLGKHLAYAEMRIILCKLLYNFDIELCPESENWIDQEVYFLWDKPPLMVSMTERPRPH